MAKILSKYKALDAFINENTDYSIHNNVLYCDVCNEIKIYVPSEGVSRLRRHLVAESHLKKKQIKERQMRLEYDSDSYVKNTFHYNLVNAFSKANIPLYKLQNPHLKSFFRKYNF